MHVDIRYLLQTMCDEMCCVQPTQFWEAHSIHVAQMAFFCPLILHILHAKNSLNYLMASVQTRAQPSVLQAQTQLFHRCKIWKMRPAHICRLLSRTGRGECIFLLTLTGGEVKPWGCCMTSAQQNWHDLSPATERGDIHNILTGKSCGK